MQDRIGRLEETCRAQRENLKRHQIFLKALETAKPGEEQTLMVMRLDPEPQEQKIFDEAKEAIHAAVSKTRCDCLTQVQEVFFVRYPPII